MPRTRRLAGILFLTSVLVTGAGCRTRPDEGEVRIDLVRLFPMTDRGQEVQVIDLGTPAADGHLLGGWSQNDTLPSGESVVWGVGRRASLRFAIREPAEGRLIARCG